MCVTSKSNLIPSMFLRNNKHRDVITLAYLQQLSQEAIITERGAAMEIPNPTPPPFSNFSRDPEEEMSAYLLFHLIEIAVTNVR